MTLTVKLDISKLKSIVELLFSATDDTAKLLISKGGIVIMAVDPAHVLMYRIMLKPDAFTEYVFESDSDNQESWLDLEEIRSNLKDYGMGTATLELGDKNHMTLETGGNTINIDLDTPEAGLLSDPKIPELGLMSSFDMINIGPLVPFMDTLERFTDQVAVTTEGVEVNFSYLPDCDVKRATCLSLPITPRDGYKVGEQAQYNVEYLKSVIKAILAITEGATISYDTDRPIVLKFYHEGVGGAFYLAPQIQ